MTISLARKRIIDFSTSSFETFHTRAFYRADAIKSEIGYISLYI